MTTLSNQRYYRQIILDHSSKPQHQGQTDPVDRHHRGNNPYCGDTIELTLALDQAQEKIKDVKFEGTGCALCIASADLMAGAIRGKSIQEALAIVQQFRQMIIGETQLAPPLDKLNIMQGVSQYPVRIKCATLAWHTLKGALTK